LLAAAAVAAAGQSPSTIEHGTLRLHYVQKPVGYERYTIDRDDGSLQLTSDFDFTDRGGRVQLAATLRTQADLTPIRFTAKGKTYRFVNVDSDIAVERLRAKVRADGRDVATALPKTFFTVDGYAPFSAQMLMLRYWQQHGKPRVLPTLPGQSGDQPNDVIIEARGRETVKVGAKSVSLNRFSVDGVVWGRETLWVDDGGSIAAAITRAGGLSFEAVRDDLEPALVDFVTSGTRDRIADLEAITRREHPLHAGAFALVGGTVIDATGRAPIPDAAVVVQDGRFVDVGPSRAVGVPPGVPVVRVDGKTIVPGLWDMHTHVTQVEWAPVYLAAGVTTVRDMGNEFEFITALRAAVESQRALGPRLLLAGLIDGGGPNAFGVYDAATPEQAVRLVRKYHDAGFQQIKVYSFLTAPVVAAICSEAHRLGMTVTGHVPNGMTIEQGVNAGMDHIAHLPIRGEAGTPDVDLIVAFLKRHKTVVDPTQSWGELLGHAAGTPIADFQPGINRIPPPLNRLFTNAGTSGIDVATARARVERGLRIVRELHEAGVPVVVGTDEGIPGHSVHREIELYVEAGLTPMEALQAATIVSARAMKLDDQLGTIEKGKRADLAILDANPLDRIQNIRTVRWTIIDGRVYDASNLWKSVRFTP
ncbi:MAG TPA: amidohydrolase family protein, partial [Vicinamibacterales bacterium]